MAEDADLIAELEADQGHWNGLACSWRAWLEQQPPDEAAQWRAVLIDKRFTLSSVERALKKRGVKIGRSSLARHRHGECKQCPI